MAVPISKVCHSGQGNDLLIKPADIPRWTSYPLGESLAERDCAWFLMMLTISMIQKYSEFWRKEGWSFITIGFWVHQRWCEAKTIFSLISEVLLVFP